MKTKIKIYINIISFIAIYAVVIVFVIYPILRDIKNNSIDIINKKNKEFSLQEQLTIINNFSSKEAKYAEDFSLLNNGFIDPKNPVDFIKFLELISKESDVDMKVSLVPGLAQEGNESTWNYIAFKLDFSGNFINIIAFLNRLENSSYFISVQDITINKKKQLEASCVLRAFYK